MALPSEYRFKGDGFENQYRIEGVLTAKSPVHIGTGESRVDPGPSKAQPDKGDLSDESSHEVGEIERDMNGLPILTGSALRGVIRHYLLSLFRFYHGGKIAAAPDFENTSFKQMGQDQQKDYMVKEASLLEQVFGTPFCESKLEFWDAPLVRRFEGVKYQSKGWEPERQSYVVHSVAIDPVTGAAERNKLYSFDVIPPGMEFQMNVLGRNLSDRELGMVLFGLEGFNSYIYPLTIGAMAGRGFGQMSFKLKNIYRLRKDELPRWIELAEKTDGAGYGLLGHMKLSAEETSSSVKAFKNEFVAFVKEKSK